MKNTMKYLMVLALGLITLGSAHAQKAPKIGHINSNDLLTLMPEREEAAQQLEAYAKQLETELSTMTAEWETKVEEFRSDTASPDFVLQSKRERIQDLQARIQKFQEDAQQRLAEKEQELLEPIIKKAKDAIKAAADENGYTYVFDSSVGVLIHFPESDDLMPLVKKKLNIVN
ncbi:MAG: OmpH family outer membrane protein [Salibacteraceae bacterium]